ncbi:hypothetical protein K1719_004933 [Acacia pycnantha]|nr:hypothetical protein K1719_004933 [Acacia pycnantha]
MMVYKSKLWRIVEDYFHIYHFFKVPKFNKSLKENHLYKKVSLYPNSRPSLEDSDFTNLVTSSGKNQNDIVLCLDPKQTIDNEFLEATVFLFHETEQTSDSKKQNVRAENQESRQEKNSSALSPAHPHRCR